MNLLAMHILVPFLDVSLIICLRDLITVVLNTYPLIVCGEYCYSFPQGVKRIVGFVYFMNAVVMVRVPFQKQTLAILISGNTRSLVRCVFSRH